MPGRAAAPAMGTAWGLALLGQPDALVERVAGRRPDPTERWVCRVLGARQLVQAAAVARWPSTGGRLGAAADGLHAASMVALAAWVPRYRRVALASGAAAVVLAVVELAGARGRGDGS